MENNPLQAQHCFEFKQTGSASVDKILEEIVSAFRHSQSALDWGLDTAPNSGCDDGHSLTFVDRIQKAANLAAMVADIENMDPLEAGQEPNARAQRNEFAMKILMDSSCTAAYLQSYKGSQDHSAQLTVKFAFQIADEYLRHSQMP